MVDIDERDDRFTVDAWEDAVADADAVATNVKPRRDEFGDQHGEAHGDAHPAGQAPASLYPTGIGVAMADGVDEDDGDDNYTLSTAVTYVEHYGLSAFRVTLTDKTPKLSSEALKPVRTTRRATVDELCDWFGGEPDQQSYGIGIYAGAVSGNLLIADFDRADIHDAFLQRCAEQGMGHLVVRMPHVKTRKGDHRYFRCGDYPYPKMKLAYYWDDVKQKKRTLIEVQGTGYYAVAPSRLPGMPPAPDCPYRVVSGSLGDIPVFSAEEVDALLDIMRGLTEVQPDPKPEPPLPPAPGGGNRPGDDYSARGDHRALLETHGWQYLSTRPDGTEYWRRPGKTEGSCSATYNPALGLFYVFSSNADPFEEGQAYKLFAVYALLKHGGDYSAAAKALRDDGYGASDWGDPEKVWVTEEELAHARDAIAQAQTQRTSMAIHAVVSQLAILPIGEYEDVLCEIGDAVRAVNKRDLDSAVKKARRALVAKQHLEKTKTPASSLPTLVVSDNCPFRDKGQEALRYMEQANTPPTLFRCGTDIVELTEDSKGHAVFEELGREGWINRFANACDIVTASAEGQTHIAPPAEIVTYLMGERSTHFPCVEGIASTPLVRPDGSILATPGYDPELQRILCLPKGFTLRAVSDNPSAAEIAEAKALLDEPFCDFEFDPPSCKANLYALRFAPLLEPYFQARTPLALIEAAGQRAGKTLCARAVAVETLGYEPGFMTEPLSDEEWQKQLVATLRSGVALPIVDNVDHVLRAGCLSNALTSLLWDVRELGHSRNIKLPHHAVWIATGNNIQTGGDMFRRTYSIRLRVRGSEKRAEPFKHYPLIRWVKEQWLAITWAKLTIWNAFRAANSTETWTGPTLESFDEWSGTMGQLLTFMGIAGFLADQNARQKRADTEAGQWEDFYYVLRDHFGTAPFTVSMVLNTCMTATDVKSYLPDALAGVVGEFHTGNAGHIFGQEFRKRDGTPFGLENMRLERYLPKEEQKGNRAVYWVIRSGQF